MASGNSEVKEFHELDLDRQLGFEIIIFFFLRPPVLPVLHSGYFATSWKLIKETPHFVKPFREDSQSHVVVCAILELIVDLLVYVPDIVESSCLEVV